ncbi:MAG: TlpA disulfide reductase family protein [Myxococcota bacterium]
MHQSLIIHLRGGLVVASALLVAGATGGCAKRPSAETHPTNSAVTAPAPMPRSGSAAAGPQTIEPGEVVPAFRIASVDGATLDSATIVGREPFVVMFFASWCGVCEQKLPLVQRALKEEGADIRVFGVALDEPETWDRVAPYVARHELDDVTLIRGLEHRDFATAYDPFGSVPVVMVIDRRGIIADLQRGLRADDDARLRAALRQVQSPGM